MTADRPGNGAATSLATATGAGRPDRPASGRPTRPAALTALARRHWPAAALLAGGLVLRILAEFAYRPALFYIDTPRYLFDKPPGMDPLGYLGPLRAILAVAGFGAVPAVQHLLGLAAAVVLYLLLLRRGAGRWLAALAIAPLLLDGYQLQAEQTVLPTAWFEAIVVAGLAVLLWRPGTSWRRTLTAGVLLGASATFAQIGEALLLPAVIYLLAAGGGWRRAVGRAAAMCAAFALPILLYSAGSYLLSGAFFLSHSGVTSFYGRMAAAADCRTLQLPASERAMCPTPAQQARGPDWLEYGGGSPIRPYYAHLPIAETDSLITDFNRRVLTQQPLRVLGAYGRDVVKVFALTRTGSPGDTPISRWQFQTFFPYYQHARPADVRAWIAAFGGGRPAVWQPAAGFLRGYQLGGGYLPGPLLALFTAAGLAGSVTAFRRRPAPQTRQLSLACLLFFASGVSVLGVSDLFEFSWRYQLPALITLAPAGALGIAVIARAVSARRAPAPPS